MASTGDDERQAQRRLDRMRVERPCDDSWDAMDGSGHARRCQRCDRTVHDVSRSTAAEVITLVRRPESACVRLSMRADGSVRMAESARRRLRVLGAAAGVALSSTAAWAAATWPGATLLMPDEIARPVEERTLMGLLMETPEAEPRVWEPSADELTERERWQPTAEDCAALLDDASTEEGVSVDAREAPSEPHGTEESE